MGTGACKDSQGGTWPQGAAPEAQGEVVAAGDHAGAGGVKCHPPHCAAVATARFCTAQQAPWAAEEQADGYAFVCEQCALAQTRARVHIHPPTPPPPAEHPQAHTRPCTCVDAHTHAELSISICRCLRVAAATVQLLLCWPTSMHAYDDTLETEQRSLLSRQEMLRIGGKQEGGAGCWRWRGT